MSPSTPIPVTIPFQIIIGVGLGLLFANQNPVQAPHPDSSNAAALSLLTFVRNFAQVRTSLSSLRALMFTPVLIVLGYLCRCNNTTERTPKTPPKFSARNDSARGGLHVQSNPPDPDLRTHSPSGGPSRIRRQSTSTLARAPHLLGCWNGECVLDEIHHALDDDQPRPGNRKFFRVQRRTRSRTGDDGTTD